MILVASQTACAGDDADGGPLSPALRELCRVDLMLPEADCLRISKLALPDHLPDALGNRVADDLAAARLGHRIFFDTGFSPLPNVSCRTCHLETSAFQDAMPTSVVIPGMPVARNSPSLLNAAWVGPFFFWDGRADSLWSQPLFAFESANEMGTTRLAIAHRIAATPEYRAAYEPLFGALPPLEDASRFPPSGKPGDPSFDGMAPADRDAINLVAANVGKALEAYMRKLATGPSDLDRYLAGERAALPPLARVGLAGFVRSGCIDCHSGPALTDGTFRQLRSNPTMDRGRARGVEQLLASPFNSRGIFFDPGIGEPPALPAGVTPEMEGAFRTPSLRNIVLTAPYGHAGTYGSLDDVLDVNTGPISGGDLGLLAPFLEHLNGAPPDAEWTTNPFAE